MILPQYILDEFGRKFQQSSIRTYDGRVKRLMKGMTEKETFDLQPLLNFSDVKSFVEKEDPATGQPLIKITVQKDLINTVLNVLRAENDSSRGINVNDQLIIQYEEYFNRLAKGATDYVQYQKPSVRQIENRLTWDEIVNIKNEMRLMINKMIEDEMKLSITQYQKYLALVLYTSIPPLRGGEYRDAIVVRGYQKGDTPDESQDPESPHLNYHQMTGKNIFDIKNKIFVVYKHKNTTKDRKKGFTKPRIVPIQNNVVKVVKYWKKLTKSPFLFINHISGEPMGQEAFTDMLNRIFKPKKISVDMLRNIYVSHVIKTDRENIDLRKKISYLMGHDLATQEMIYSKYRNL